MGTINYVTMQINIDSKKQNIVILKGDTIINGITTQFCQPQLKGLRAKNVIYLLDSDYELVKVCVVLSVR